MKKEMKKKIGTGAGLIVAVVALSMIFVNYAYINGEVTIPTDDIDLIGNEEENVEKEMVWHKEYVWTPTGENDPGHETGGFMSCFLLDYAQDPETVLAVNATDWENSAACNAYADSDDWSVDAPSENYSYIVIRACFTQAQAASGGVFNGSRCRVTLTVTGDETISQTITGNDTAETFGGAVESENTTDEPKLYINFYWDDNSDGYRITDDGSITISSIVIEAKY